MSIHLKKITIMVLLLGIWATSIFSQNTASTSGDWDKCQTWGYPVTLFQNNTDTKTVNTGIVVTSNVGWSTQALVLNGTGAVTFSGTGNYVRFNGDNGDDKTCRTNAVQNPGVCSNSNGWSLGGWNWGTCELWTSADGTSTVTATQSLSNVVTTGNVLRFSVCVNNSISPPSGSKSYLRVKYNGVIYATLDSRGGGGTTVTVTPQNGASGSTYSFGWTNWVDISFNLPTIPNSGVLSLEGQGTGSIGDDLQIRNIELTGYLP
ncbi:hypothetical protein HNP38_002904 [Chryseobacterium defluvii]|uniref:Uncharacterized protein n=1 Tax=Chryseobacterium defluvii TaxID=160396 RepID=A0A840KHU9_9FLAO|nr:hypothetical protein [Chryseobacterium defluvii]MBB4807598.1 hypothetical protein [Chryseobacterium defluvii]